MRSPDSQTIGLREIEQSVAAPVAVCVSIVVPCFNEEESVSQLAEMLFDLQEDHSARYSFEYLLVDDGSSDETWNVLGEHFSNWENAKLVRHSKNKGIAAAITTGITVATNEIVCSIDSDCTYHPNQLIELLEHWDDDVVLVTASPYHPKGKVLNVPEWRVKLSYLASWMYSWLMETRLYCYTSCFRIYRKSAVKDIQLKNDGFIATAELIWRLERSDKRRIIEVPAVLDQRKFGQSKFGTLSAIVCHLQQMMSFAIEKVMSR